MPCLVLDAMGVIFASADDVAELLVPFIAEHSRTGNEEIIQAAYLDASLGRIGADEFWLRVGLSAELEDDYLDMHTLNRGVLELLSLAQQVGMPVWCLSNDIASWSRKLRKRLGIEEYLQQSIISSDLGIRKPDAGIYHALIEASDRRPDELLFVDDRPANIAAARTLGSDDTL
jgi:putative hydrolase of the HAD superfamily